MLLAIDGLGSRMASVVGSYLMTSAVSVPGMGICRGFHAMSPVWPSILISC